jgi:serine/threonine protein kinase
MTDPLRERVGAAIGQQYEIEDEIGRGGMSVVYRARDTKLDRRVALKVLPPELAYDPAVRTRFTREAQTAARLSHAHIVPIYDVGEREGFAYLVMAYVTGGSLATLIAREPRQPVDEVRRILAEVADALAHAHLHGIVHRDIKPDNILLDGQTGRVLVTDFGIARAVEVGKRLTMTGIAVGTPTYMSPEQATAERDIDGRSDIYSLGVVGYQMLTGRVPFDAGSSMALLLKHVTERPRPISDLRADAPRALREAVERAMLKAPDDRWPNAIAMRDALIADGSSGPAWRAERRDVVRYHSPNPDDPRAPRGLRGSGGRDGASGSGGRLTSPRRGVSAMREESSTEAAPAPITITRRDGREIVIEPSHLVVLTTEQRTDLRLWHGRVNLLERVKAMRGYAWFTLGMWIAGLTGFAAGVSEMPPLVLSPIVPLYMSRKLWLRGRSLRESGLRLRRVLLLPLARQVIPPTPAPRPTPTQQLARVVSRDVLDGPHGAALRRAAEDRAAILEIVAALPEADRVMIPDVEPTANALVERATMVAGALLRLERDLDPRFAAELEPEYRKLENQLEDACTALAGLRLDLIKLRSSGLSAGMNDVTTATRAARALAREIAVAVEAVGEVRRGEG